MFTKNKKLVSFSVTHEVKTTNGEVVSDSYSILFCKTEGGLLQSIFFIPKESLLQLRDEISQALTK